jgi:hypothetical protein
MPSRDLSTRLARFGRLSLVFEPRDIWVGVFIGPAAVYAGIPFLVLRWERQQRPALVKEAATEGTRRASH